MSSLFQESLGNPFVDCITGMGRPDVIVLSITREEPATSFCILYRLLRRP